MLRSGLLLFAGLLLGGVAFQAAEAQATKVPVAPPVAIQDSSATDVPLGPLDADACSKAESASGSDRWYGTSDREARARWAARMDPGILMYREPLAGTRMPHLGGDAGVDPEMIVPPRSMNDCND